MLVVVMYARSEDGVIGVDGQIPWTAPSDLARFRRLTLGRPIIMGRRTWESLTTRPLPGRPNFVVTKMTTPGRKSDGDFAGAIVAPTLLAAIEDAKSMPACPVFVIGGASIIDEATMGTEIPQRYEVEIWETVIKDFVVPIGARDVVRVAVPGDDWKECAAAQIIEGDKDAGEDGSFRRHGGDSHASLFRRLARREP